MKKLIISFTALLVISSCKGPGSGPLVKESFDKKAESQTLQGQKSSGPVQTEKIKITIEPCEGCITIADLLANKKSYSGKVVKIKGRVIKFNQAIMGKNWVHIQDGTEFEGAYDLTVTTDMQVPVGEINTFEGKIVLDKDFGYGYFYNVLMEDSKIVQ